MPYTAPVVGTYTKNPEVVTALLWDGQNFDDLVAFCSPLGLEPYRNDYEVTLDTCGTKELGNIGDYIILNEKSEYHFVKPDVFAARYTVSP
jgi:hypothetical protein